MRKLTKVLAVAAMTVGFLAGTASTAAANPSPPTNGGSANGAGQSGQCTGANADRPAACHNSHGSGN